MWPSKVCFFLFKQEHLFEKYSGKSPKIIITLAKTAFFFFLFVRHRNKMVTGASACGSTQLRFSGDIG